MTRIPAAFRAAHEFEARPRNYVGTSHRYGVTVPEFRYPWRCSCGAEGRHGGRRGKYGSHEDHVHDAWHTARGATAARDDKDRPA